MNNVMFKDENGNFHRLSKDVVNGLPGAKLTRTIPDKFVAVLDGIQDMRNRLITMLKKVETEEKALQKKAYDLGTDL